MAFINDGRATAGLAAVEQLTKAQRVTLAPRGYAYSVSGITGIMAAALAANSSIFTMRSNPASGKRLFIDRIRIQYTTLVAFTTALTAARRLAVTRSTAASASPSGGTAITTVAQKNISSVASICSSAGSGDIRIATTGLLTMTGITLDTNNPAAQLSLSHVGAAGGFYDFLLNLASADSAPFIIEPGQVLSVFNPAAMDAGGTWQAMITVHWYEANLWEATTSE